MICDDQTNKVFLSKGLMHYGRILERLLSSLSGWSVETQFLPMADSKKHVWARDYMPIQLEKDKFLLYRYPPDYLKGFEDFIPQEVKDAERREKLAMAAKAAMDAVKAASVSGNL